MRESAIESGASSRYRPIEDYALIGDCHGCALVARDGSIDWAALKRFDADPVFCRILDVERGGFWSIRPTEKYRVERAYLPGTNVLRTVFTTGEGKVALTDFMPVGRKLNAGAHDYVHLNAPGWIVRRIEGLQGNVSLEIKYRPSRAFAAERVELAIVERAVCGGEKVPTLFSDLDFALEGDLAMATLRARQGERRELALADNTVEGEWPCARADELLQATRAFWEEWIAYCRYRGPYRAAVARSALTLKLLTYAPTGAIVAAATTSLPEEIGGERNWDYRYCWVRDSSFALYALAALGYSGEARCFHDFLLSSCARSLPLVQAMYGVDGEMQLDEGTLGHLDGYRGSAPVRTGNGAFRQRQIDVYGQALDLSLLYKALGGRLDEQYRRLLTAIAKFTAAHWQEPDQGLWEARGTPRHYVHGKMMSWVAMDRAARLLDKAAEWQSRAQQIAADIQAHGVSSEDDSLQQAYDGGTDAAVLLAPMFGFPLKQKTLERTIDCIIRTLGRGDYLARYAADDGLSGDEGAFLVCSSWLVDAQLACGRRQEATALFERLMGCANDVGLYSEEIDPSTGAFLGNFPQALTHLGVIGNAVNLRLAERHGTSALQGSYADRAKRVITATFGWRGVLAAMKQSRRVGRLFSSKRSKLAWP